MKINIAIVLVLLITGFGLSFFLQTTPPLSTPVTPEKMQKPTGEQAPYFEFTDINGNNHKISDFRGKTVILNFWASWCPPCVAEFPHLLDFAATTPNVILIALSSDQSRADIETFLKKIDLTSKKNLGKNNVIIAQDENKAITNDLFQTVSLPETIIIDAEQKLVGKIVGPIIGDETLRRIIPPGP